MAGTQEAKSPTRVSTAIFYLKAILLQVHRAIADIASSIHRHPRDLDSRFTVPLATSSTPLWTDVNPGESWYQRGKIQNLRLAAACLHQCVIPANEVFSFWRQVGRAAAHKGYVPGRMLQEGCVIPAVGGGLCQLSNALYQVAQQAGCEILERHPHSRVVPGSATASGRDATVAWNYIDLRFRPKATMQLRVMLTASDLHVSLQGIEAASIPSRISRSVEEGNSNAVALPGIFSDHACESCGNVSCFRHSDAPAVLNRRTVTAFLVDSAWPEFKTHVVSNHTSSDILCIPMDGERWNRLQYAWPTAGFAARHTATLTTLLRMLESRRLATQGAARQKSLLERADALARQLARSLVSDVDEVCVDQGLLPFLWRTGLLGGRRIRVFMTRLPLAVLEATLDRAFTMHPESRTLRDFRAEKWLLDAEAEALSYAEEIVTPHAQIASLFPSKRVLLNWAMTPVSDGQRPSVPDGHPTVLLPTSTLGRKGAYELREALDGLDITLVLGGKVLEDENFWSGYRVKFADLSRTISADLVVQPSVVESQPRGLLRALS